MTSGVARPHGGGLLRLPHYRIRHLFASLPGQITAFANAVFTSTDRPRPDHRRQAAHRERFIEDAAMRREMFRL